MAAPPPPALPESECHILVTPTHDWATQQWATAGEALCSTRQFLDDAGNDDLVRLTSCSNLDMRLGGGFETGWITEVSVSPDAVLDLQSTGIPGRRAVPPTRYPARLFGHTLSVACQLPVTLGGGEGKMCYIDASGRAFDANRVASLANDHFRLHSGDVLDNIVVWPARPYFVDKLMQDQPQTDEQLLQSFASGTDLLPLNRPAGRGLEGSSERVAGWLAQLLRFVQTGLLPYSRFVVVVIDLSGLAQLPRSPQLAEELVLLALTGVAAVTITTSSRDEGPLIGGALAGKVYMPSSSPIGCTLLCIRNATRLRWEAARRAVRARSSHYD